jgi:LPXTG-site transpeptidase (sortase) family protein
MSRIIYSSSHKSTHRQYFLIIDWFEEKVRQIFKIFGAGILAFAIVLFMFSYGQILSQEVSYFFHSSKPVQDGPVVKQDVKADNLEEVESEARKYNLTAYFSLVIPKIDASANIVPNVDINDRVSYLAALQKGIAHAKGTSFPGQAGRIFLFSHSTDSPANFAKYNAIFYLLRKLEKGDKITVFFTAKKYVYEVSDKIITSANDTTWIEPKLGEEQLVLMTCDPPGTTWNRLLIIATPITS